MFSAGAHAAPAASLIASTSTLRSDWDPLGASVPDPPPTRSALRRIRSDLLALSSEAHALPGVFVVPDESRITLMHVLIVGPAGTPYENGFFYFVLTFPHDYPDTPPRVKLLTTGGGTVRFNPNLYANGKVCLSILGTWHGPGWSPANTLASVLVSVQSLMNECPYVNEPGYEASSGTDAAREYSRMISFETLRWAVLDNVRRKDSMPAPLRETMLPMFLELRESYIASARRLAALCDGRRFTDPFSPAASGTHTHAARIYAFADMAQKIDALAGPVQSEIEASATAAAAAAAAE